MSDSFFTTRNQVDPQVESAGVFFCNELIDASTRRLAKLEGPLETAKRLQRIADICAGAYVLPIEHRVKAPEPKPEPPALPKPGRLKQVWLAVQAEPLFLFWTGTFFGMWLGAR